MEQEQKNSPPTREQLEQELKRTRRRGGRRRGFRGGIALRILIALAVIVAVTMVFPVLRIYGNSMTPTLKEGDIVVTLKGSEYERGDLVAFYYNNKMLVKRVVALPGEWVDIDEEGRVYINDILQEEEYLEDGARDMGECDIELPYQVPEGKVFVMGDHRSVSRDSRSRTIGCVLEERIVGRLLFRLWPVTGIGPID